MGNNDPHAGPGLSTLGSVKKTWTSLAALLWEIYSRVWQIYLWLVSSWVSLSGFLWSVIAQQHKATS